MSSMRTPFRACSTTVRTRGSGSSNRSMTWVSPSDRAYQSCCASRSATERLTWWKRSSGAWVGFMARTRFLKTSVVNAYIVVNVYIAPYDTAVPHVAPYHHGNLRAELLSRAERKLETAGVTGLSLRELAREIGVSHGAPRQHFPDRQALLDALA